jgi:hypothetical protein
MRHAQLAAPVYLDDLWGRLVGSTCGIEARRAKSQARRAKSQARRAKPQARRAKPQVAKAKTEAVAAAGAIRSR